MTGDHRESLRDAAVSQRNTGQFRGGNRGRHTGHDLDLDSGLSAGDDLFHAASEHERVSAFEPDYDTTLARRTDQDVVDLLLSSEPSARDLRDVNDLDTLTQPVQNSQWRQPVDDHDISIGQCLKPPT